MWRCFIAHKRAWIMLGIALAVILVSSFLACLVQSAGFKVKVYDLRDVTNTGVVMTSSGEAPVKGEVKSGILFVPKKASADNKLPAVVLTHGYLNNRELQLQNAIELARRGFVVLTVDREGHGNYENSGETGALMATSGLYESAKYLYNLDYVDQSRIGISGHSMGGYTTAMTLYNDSMGKPAFDESGKATGNGLGIISAGLMQGWSTFIFANSDVSVANLKASDDEFFYNSTDYQGTKTIARQYLQSKAAAQFVGAAFSGPIDVVNGGIYIGGKLTEVKEGTAAPAAFRAVYESDEIHPLNHFSVASASAVVNFFYTAFGTPDGYSYIPSSRQTWTIKEAFSCIGLAAFFFMIFPLATLLLELPLFRSLKKKEEPALLPLKGVQAHLTYWIPAIICTLLSGIMIRVMNDVGSSWFPQNHLYPQDTTNWISMWALASGLIALGMTLLTWFVNYMVNTIRFKEKGASLTANPFKPAVMATGLEGFIKTAFLAFLIVAIQYLTLFATWAIFKVDFRIWTLDVKVFEIPKMLPTMLRYTMIFGVFYCINSLFSANYQRQNIPEWASTAIAAFFNVFGIFLMMAIQYATFRSTGVLWQADMALGYIALFPIVPILVIATVISRSLYRKTGNIWLGGLLNSLLFTVITVANTASSYSFVLA